jgi:glucose/arabinose dehydrogenase
MIQSRSIFLALILLIATLSCGTESTSIDGGRLFPTQAPLSQEPIVKATVEASYRIALTATAEAETDQVSNTKPSTSPVSQIPSTLSSTPIPSVPLQLLNVQRVFPNVSFKRMVDLVFSNDNAERAFLVLQSGRIEVFDYTAGNPQPQEFLDIRNKVSNRGNEEGLLGMTLSPKFLSDGHFYLYYSAADPRRSVISRFSVKSDNLYSADPSSEQVILEVSQPHSNHNGGQIHFGPDGFLYISLGDGGSRGDPEGNGQNLTTLLGSILRINVGTLDSLGTYSVPSGNPFTNSSNSKSEIWAYGLRNPWRFSFDSVTGDLWVGDVGQRHFEEINLVTRGGNYGWNVMEGFHCYTDADGSCDQSGLESPVAEYGRDGGCSVTGGYVYRGSRLPELSGAYVYGDYCTGKIWALRHDGAQITEHLQIVDSSLTISSFAQSPSGEIFILSFDEKIYRFIR